MPRPEVLLDIPTAYGDAYTTITRNDDGQIAKLYTYCFKVPENEYFAGIDYYSLRIKHPYARIGALAFNVGVNDGDISAIQAHPITIGPYGITEPPDVFTSSEEGIAISQRVDIVSAGAVATAVFIND